MVRNGANGAHHAVCDREQCRGVRRAATPKIRGSEAELPKIINNNNDVTLLAVTHFGEDGARAIVAVAHGV
jgi:hypothetical protein